MSWCRWTVLVLWFAAALSVAGQTSNVTQCISSVNWSINSLRQTPCYVAAILESGCGTPTSVDSIPPNNHYLAPISAEADPCRCSSVTYSMISACAACQDRTFTNWTTWSANCMSTAFMTFPKTIPPSVVVPNWAYLNITLTNNTFSALAAQQNLSNNTPTPSISVSTNTIVSISSSTPSTAGKTHSNAGAIAGGVVGGLVLLAVIALVSLWCILRKRRKMIQKDITFDSRALVSGPSVSQTAASGPSPFPSQSIYTSDMSAFPGSPLTTSGIYTTIPPSRRSLESVSLSVAQMGGVPHTHGIGPARHGYTGMPEV